MSLIPLIRSLASERYLRLVSLILSLGEIMPSYFYYIEKRLSYIAILAPSGRQLFFYTKCTKLNMRLSYDVKLVFNTKYTYFMRSYVL